MYMYTREMYGYSLLFSTTPTVYVYVHTSTRSTKLPAIYQLRFYLFTCLQVQLYLSLYLFICLVINTHIHMKERIMDDFDPTNPATLSGHLKALELLGQLTARAGPARRYVRAYMASLTLTLTLFLSHTRRLPFCLYLSLSLSLTHTHTDTHSLCPSSLTTISPRSTSSPMKKINLTSISGRL